MIMGSFSVPFSGTSRNEAPGAAFLLFCPDGKEENMAYTLQEIFAALGKTENGGAMVADLQDAISQVRNEAASYRTKRNEVLDALGLRDGENTDAALKALAQTLSAVKKAGSPETLGAQMESLQKEVKELTAKYAASEQKAAAEREKRIGASRTAALPSPRSRKATPSPRKPS